MSCFAGLYVVQNNMALRIIIKGQRRAVITPGNTIHVAIAQYSKKRQIVAVVYVRPARGTYRNISSI